MKLQTSAEARSVCQWYLRVLSPRESSMSLILWQRLRLFDQAALIRSGPVKAKLGGSSAGSRGLGDKARVRWDKEQE